MPDMQKKSWWGRDDDFFDYAKLTELAAAKSADYRNASPYPHCVIDDFISPQMVDRLLGNLPPPDATKQRQNNTAYDEDNKPVQLNKIGIQDEKFFPPFLRAFFHEMNSWSFLRFLERLSGIQNLLPDPSLRGGGVHQTAPGGLLQLHADFNQHPVYGLDRRMNILVYLNKDWQDSYGGHIELWNKDLTRCEKRILPVAGRCVIFNTTSESWHGHPQPLSCPDGMMRRSLALYYYTNGRPEEEARPRHKVIWKAPNAPA